jgi:hypothetical protein
MKNQNAISIISLILELSDMKLAPQITLIDLRVDDARIWQPPPVI